MEPKLQKELLFVFFEAGHSAVFSDNGAMADEECNMSQGNSCYSKNKMHSTDLNP